MASTKKTNTTSTRAPKECQTMANSTPSQVAGVPLLGGVPQDHIEYMMRGAPHIWTDRTRVLEHVLLQNGTGYQWLADGSMGSLYNPYPFEEHKKDVFEDLTQMEQMLLERKERYAGGLKEWDDTDYQLVKLQQERLNRAFTLEHVSVIAKHKKGVIPFEHLVNGVCTPGGALAQWLDLEVKSAPWTEAVWECARAVAHSIRSAPAPEREKLSTYQQQTLAQWNDLLIRLDGALQVHCGKTVFPNQQVLGEIFAKLKMQ